MYVDSTHVWHANFWEPAAGARASLRLLESRAATCVSASAFAIVCNVGGSDKGKQVPVKFGQLQTVTQHHIQLKININDNKFLKKPEILSTLWKRSITRLASRLAVQGKKQKKVLVVAPGWRRCKGPRATLTFTRGEKLSGSAYVLMSPLSCPFGHCGESSSLSAGCSGWRWCLGHRKRKTVISIKGDMEVILLPASYIRHLARGSVKKNEIK